MPDSALTSGNMCMAGPNFDTRAAVIAASTGRLPAPAAGEPEVPMIDQNLTAAIGMYGMARYDRESEAEILHRWQRVLSGIKDYARAYGDARAEHARRVAMEEAYSALFTVKGDKATLFDAQTAIRAAAPQGEKQCTSS